MNTIRRSLSDHLSKDFSRTPYGLAHYSKTNVRIPCCKFH